jgi:hypothetical protein
MNHIKLENVHLRRPKTPPKWKCDLLDYFWRFSSHFAFLSFRMLKDHRRGSLPHADCISLCTSRSASLLYTSAVLTRILSGPELIPPRRLTAEVETELEELLSHVTTGLICVCLIGISLLLFFYVSFSWFMWSCLIDWEAEPKWICLLI